MEWYRIIAFISLKCLKDKTEKILAQLKKSKTKKKYLKNVLYVILTFCPAFGLSLVIHIVMSDVNLKRHHQQTLVSKAASGKHC